MLVEEINTVAIVGAGFIGPGIAQIFALKGYRVYLMDIKPEMLHNAIHNIQASLQQMTEAKVIAEKEIDSIIRRILVTTSMKDAVKSSQVVIEAVTENLALKQHIFQELDTLCPKEIILCTNTSVMSVTEIASQAVHRERIVGTHFWNPPYLIPLVEVVKGKDTSEETLNLTYDFLRRAGKHPVKCLKDVPGFIANRLQHALWREAISMVENGIADAETIDEAIKHSFAIRLPVLGPLENADMIGLDLTFAIHDYILKNLEDSHQPSKLLQEKIQRGELGFKSGKGFYRWSPQDIEQSREKLAKFLIDRQKDQLRLDETVH